VYRDKLRLYEQGGTNRGFSMDMSSAGASVSSIVATTTDVRDERIRFLMEVI